MEEEKERESESWRAESSTFSIDETSGDESKNKKVNPYLEARRARHPRGAARVANGHAERARGSCKREGEEARRGGKERSRGAHLTNCGSSFFFFRVKTSLLVFFRRAKGGKLGLSQRLFGSRGYNVSSHRRRKGTREGTAKKTEGGAFCFFCF